MSHDPFNLYNPPRPWVVILEGHSDEVGDACAAVITNQSEAYVTHHFKSLDDDCIEATIDLKLTDPTMITLVNEIVSVDFPFVTIKYNDEVPTSHAATQTPA